MTGALEVTIGEDTINKDNLEDWFEDCEQILAEEQEEIDVTYMRGLLQIHKNNLISRCN